MSATVHDALAREFSAMLAAFGGEMIESTVNLWSSGTLTGVRHAFLFGCAEAIPAERECRLARYLAEREFAIDSGFVADTHLSRTGSGIRLRIEALTLAA